MSSAQIAILGSIIAYFIAMICIGFYASRNQSHEGFVIGSRNVGYIPTLGSLASTFRDGMGIIFWFGFGATAGYAGIWMFIGSLAGLIFYSFIGPKARDIAAKHDYITIGEMVRLRTGVITERIIALVIVVFALMVIAVQLHVSGHLFSTVLGMDPWIGVCSVACIVGFYLYFGGYSTVVRTDAVQFFLIISMIIVPLFFPPPKEDVLNFSSILDLGWGDMATFFAIGMLFVMSSAETWQRVFSARSAKVIQRAFPLSGIFLIIMTLSLIFLGMASKPYLGENISTSESFYEIFKGDFISTPLLSYIAVIVMAICMSTLDTACYLTASTIAKNYMPKTVTNTREKYVKFSQIIMLLILAGMSAMALSIGDVVQFLFSAASLMFVMAPVYVLTAFGYPKKKRHKTDTMVAVSVAISCIVYIYMFSHSYFEDTYMIMVPVVVSTVLVLISVPFGRTILKKRKKKKRKKVKS